jgi:alpha-amylase
MESDVAIPAMYQSPNALDSVLHYPMYYALVDAFAIPGKQNISALVDFMAQSKAAFQDTTVLGNFIENQDNPRWANISVDPVSLKNAMVFNWMTDG